MKYLVTLASYPIGIDPALTGPIPSTLRDIAFDTDAEPGNLIWAGYLKMVEQQDAAGKKVGWPPYTTINQPSDAPELVRFTEAINLFCRFMAGEGRDTCDRVHAISLIPNP